jgi:hypothetical protein
MTELFRTYIRNGNWSSSSAAIVFQPKGRRETERERGWALKKRNDEFAQPKDGKSKAFNLVVDNDDYF